MALFTPFIFIIKNSPLSVTVLGVIFDAFENAKLPALIVPTTVKALVLLSVPIPTLPEKHMPPAALTKN
jgi:hypothetical protein